MKNYGQNYPNLSMEGYKRFFRVYRDMVNADKKNQFDYNTLVQTLEYVDIGSSMNDKQLQLAMKYVATDKIHKIPRRYRLRN